MTAFVEMFLICILLLLGFVAGVWVGQRYQEAANAVVSGVWNGSRLPLFRRKRLVFAVVLQYGAHIMTTNFMMGIAMLIMRGLASDERVAQFAMLPAIAFFAVSALASAIMPIHVRRLLRFLETLPEAPKETP